MFKTDISPEQRSTLENSLNQCVKECERNDENYEKINSIKNFLLPELPSKNSLIPNASCKIRLNSSPEMGRHLIASQDIEPGKNMNFPHLHSVSFVRSTYPCYNFFR